MEDESSGSIPTVDVAQAVDVVWTFVCFVLVLLMQAGFACYEVGTIRAVSSTQHILLKNIGDAVVGLAAWYLVGHSIAVGTDVLGVFGKPSVFLTENLSAQTSEEGIALLFLEFLYLGAFATTCTTIVSDAFLTSALFFPVLAHWVWSERGWASSTRKDPWLGCGVVDFAGSGVVHMLGGGIGHFISRKVASRPARFFKAWEWDSASNLKNPTNCRQLNESGFRPNDRASMTLGCFLLWLGWYGFNCGSTLEISTLVSQNTAGRAAINTTLGAAFGGIFSVGFELAYHLWSPSYRRRTEIEDPLYEVDIDVDKGDPADRSQREARQQAQLSRETFAKIRKYQDEHPGSLDNPSKENVFKWPHPKFKWPFSTHKNLHGAAINGILAGLVGITAGCATMSYHLAVGVSFISALLYHVSYRGFMCWMIDDAVSAGAVHLMTGAWGLFAAGFTGVEAARLDAGYPSQDSCSRGSQTLANMFMVVITFFYVVVCTWVLWGVFGILKLVKLAQAGKVVDKAELEGISKLKDDLIRRDLAMQRQMGEKEEKIEFQLDQLANRVEDLDTHRLNDVEASLLARVKDIAGLVERLEQLENAGRNTSTSTLRQAASSSENAIRQRGSTAQERAPIVDAPHRLPSANSARSMPREKSCRVS